MSYSKDVIISNNFIEGFKDKCVSIGESSEVKIDNLISTECSIGIAVKDNSLCSLSDSIIINNSDVGVSVYKKKPEFVEKSIININNVIFWSNATNMADDDYGEINIHSSIVENMMSAELDIDNILPDREELLSAGLTNRIINDLYE